MCCCVTDHHKWSQVLSSLSRDLPPQAERRGLGSHSSGRGRLRPLAQASLIQVPAPWWAWAPRDQSQEVALGWGTRGHQGRSPHHTASARACALVLQGPEPSQPGEGRGGDSPAKRSPRDPRMTAATVPSCPCLPVPALPRGPEQGGRGASLGYKM